VPSQAKGSSATKPVAPVALSFAVADCGVVVEIVAETGTPAARRRGVAEPDRQEIARARASSAGR
jgi:hypothetical protein